MKHFIVTICFAAIAASGICQNKLTQNDLLGTWKVKVLTGDNGLVYCDVTKDSLYISDAVRKTWKTEQDSVITMATMKIMTEVMKEMEWVFADKGVFVEKRADKSKEGSFSFDEASGILTTHTKTDQRLKASMENGLLKLSSETPKGKDLVMYLQKQ